MAIWQNNAEGGTNGATVTVGNSGGASGDPFSLVTNTGGSLTFASSAAYSGNLGYRLVMGGSQFLYVNTGQLSTSYQRLRLYLKLDNYPPDTIQFIQVNNASGGISGWIFLDASGQLYLVDANQSFRGNTTNGLPVGTWLRLDMIWNPGAGTVKFAYAIGDGAAIETVTRSGLSLGASGPRDMMIGCLSGTTNWAMSMDSLVTDNLSSTTFIGPSSLNRLKVGTTTPTLRYGTAAPSAVYAGTTQIWP